MGYLGISPYVIIYQKNAIRLFLTKKDCYLMLFYGIAGEILWFDTRFDMPNQLIVSSTQTNT